jgi:hypothetical protein
MSKKQIKRPVKNKRKTVRRKKVQKRKPIANIGGLTLHQIGGSLKSFRQRLQKKLCAHPRRSTHK